MVIIDTNIVIDHLRKKNGHSLLDQIAKKVAKEDLAISLITVQELYEGKSTKELIGEEALLAILNSVRILSYTYDVAELAGKIARDLKKSTSFADAAIAATTIINGGELFTLDKKGFFGIENLRFYSL